MDLENYRQQAREFLSRRTEEARLHHAGLKSDLAVEALYRDGASLFSSEVVQQLFERMRTAGPDDEKSSRELLRFSVDHALYSEVFAEDQQLARALSEAKLPFGGKDVGFHQASVILANEKDGSQRECLYRARAAVIESTNPVRRARLEKIHRRARSFNAGTYAQLYQLLTTVNLGVLARQLENFLGASESYYSSRLERYANKMVGAGLGTLKAWDVPQLMRGHPYDAMFPQDRMLSLLKRTLMGLGLDLKKQQNLRIDSEERPAKLASAACFAVDVPDAVHLVLRPQGGVSDFLQLFHEAGKALHLGFTSARESFENKYLGDAAVQETYGFLFQYLTLNEDWLQDFLKVNPDETDFVDYNQFRKLYLLRRYAGRFLFELELHSRDDLADPALPGLYASTMQRALHHPVLVEHHLYDLEDGFGGTRFLRAWIFEAELRQILSEHFSHRWYSRPAAGDFLRQMWTYGFRYDCDELAARIRKWGLNIDPITKELQR